MKTALIAAVGPNNEMGYQGNLPWKIKEDLAYFKKVTTDSTVIMGRGTWDSLNRKPLPNRFNIIVTRDKSLQTKRRSHQIGLEVPFFAESIEAALMVAQLYNNGKPVFFIGGADIYQQALSIVDNIYLTIVEKMSETIKADVFFPEFNISEYEILSEETYFTAEYTVTNLVLSKVKTNGKRTDRKSSSLDNKSASGKPSESKSGSTIHWEGSKQTTKIPRGY